MLSRRNRLYLAILLAFLVGVSLLMWRLLADIDPRYRESAEESLVETTHLLAALVEHASQDGSAGLDTRALERLFADVQARRFEADIFGFVKTRVELQAVVVDRQGRVVFDSTGRALGADFSQWRDVRLALAGRYGARTTIDADAHGRAAVMHVAVPIRLNGEVVGAVAAGKPMRSLGQFVDAARRKTVLVGLGSALAVLLAVETEKALGEARARAAIAGERPGVMFVLSMQGGRVMAAGRNTAAAAIIDLGGGRNVFDSFEGYKQVSDEAIIAAAPRAVVMMDRSGDHAAADEELFAHPAIASTPAGATRSVLRMDGITLLGFGPRTARAIDGVSAFLRSQAAVAQ